MSDNRIFDGLEARRARVSQTDENTARPGRVLSSYHSTGVGAVLEPVCFDFSTSFTAKPYFTFGSEVLSNVSIIPVCTATVYQWRQTANGFYTGAYCGFYVGALGSDSSYDVMFHLVWEGIMIKNFISSLGFPVQSLDI